MKTVAFIGIGNMGKPMALNLVKKGFQVRVYDLNTQAVKECSQAGAYGSSSIEEALQGAEVVITMLPAAKHVEDIYLGSGNILNLVQAGSLLIDCSTISSQSAEKVAKAATQKKLAMLCAPVSGGVGGATAGTLTFMVGGPTDTFTKAKPIFEAMGKNIFHAGTGFGAGQAAKVCNNMLLAIHMIGTAEALNMGEKLGLDPKVLSEIMSKSSGRNWSLELYNPYPGVMENVPSSRNYQGGFGVGLMLKDLGLALEAAKTCQSKIPLGEKSHELYQKHLEAGAGQLDFSSILNWIKSK